MDHIVALLQDPEAWIALGTLTALEIVLGVDNIIFISILASRLPEEQRDKARWMGLMLAMGSRIVLLMGLSWLIGLTAPWFTVFGNELSGRDIILIAGGLFLIFKATREIHHKLEVDEAEDAGASKVATFGGVLVQIMIIDVVFSFDSVITAVGMVDEIAIMVTAVVISVGFMMLSAKKVGEFVERHPTVKMLALSFLLLIGMALIADGWDLHIPKGYIYFAMGFSVFVELLNMKMRKNKKPLHLGGSPKAVEEEA